MSERQQQSGLPTLFSRLFGAPFNARCMLGTVGPFAAEGPFIIHLLSLSFGAVFGKPQNLHCPCENHFFVKYLK